MKNSVFITFLILTLALAQHTYGQKPEISNLNRKVGPLATVVTISGSGFSTNANDLLVYFGSAKGRILSSTSNIIEVQVPAGATFDQVSVTNLASGQTGYSRDYFLLSFRGEGFDPGRLSDLSFFNEENGLFDVCDCDIDGDGLNDLITTNNSEDAFSTSITIFRNTTADNSLTPGFQRINDPDLNIANAARNLTCGDLDGDGKPELVVGKGGNNADRIYIFKNQSTVGAVNYAPFVAVQLSENATASGTRKLKIHDMDVDGRPDIIMTDQGSGKIFVFRNEGAQGQINFPNTSRFIITTSGPSLGLEVADMNGDNRPEIVYGSNLSADVFIVKNNSAPGSLSFGTPQRIAVDGDLVNLVLADLDIDGDLDIAVANFVNNIFILRNTSSSGNISVSAPIVYETGRLPWGLAVGDLDGNGKPDLVVTTNDEVDKITVFQNKSDGGTLSLTGYEIGERNISRNIRITDINGDARPDVVYTTDEINQVQLLRNQHCVRPGLGPDNPPKICDGKTVTLQATRALKSTYEWYDANGAISGAPDQPTYDASTAGVYSVRLFNTADNCDYTSNEITIQSSTASLPTTPAISGDLEICENETLTLSTNTVSGVQYFWNTPTGVILTGSTITIDAATAEDAGRYTLVLEDDGCRTDPVSEIVNVNIIPEMVVTAEQSTIFCDGTSNLLSVALISNATYSWYRDGNLINGASGNTYEATSSGTYRSEVTDANGCTDQSNTITIQSAAKPVASFDLIGNPCLGTAIPFENNSTSDPNVTTFYNWDFGDGEVSNLENPTHEYEFQGNYTVTLNVNYGGGGCFDETTQDLSVSELFAANIKVNGKEAPDGVANLCEGSVVTLSVDVPDGQLTWSTGSQNNEIQVNTPGLYSVTTGGGSDCTSYDEVTLEEVPNVNVEILTEETKIARGERIQLEATGADFYKWEPEEILDDAFSPTPIASPDFSTTFKVTGSNSFDCSQTDSVRINIEGDRSIQVIAEPLFTPNDDGINDLWRINNVNNFTGCDIKIFNRNGQTVREDTGITADWAWDGKMEGNDLPDGAYYFVLSCGDQETYSGSVTVVR